MNVSDNKPTLRQWLVLVNGIQRGPLAEAELLGGLAQGQIPADALVSCGNGWHTASALALDLPVLERAQTAHEPSLPPPGQPTPYILSSPLEPASIAPAPERDRVVVIGRRQAGKTIYLANLYATLWRSRDSMSARALSGEVHRYLMESHNALRAGQWPAATLGTSRLELEIEYHGHKHLLVALDFAGEVFARAFLHEQTDSPEAKELLNHLDSAAAVILLVDPSVGAGTDQDAVMEDDFGLVQAVTRIRNWPGGDQVPIVLVLTKMDQYQDLAERYGGAADLVGHHFPALVRLLNQVVIFQVSAVQVCCDEIGRTVPQKDFVPANLQNPLKYCLRAIDAARHKAARQQREEQAHIEAQMQVERQRQVERRQNLTVAIIIAVVVIAGACVAVYLLHSGR